MNAKCLALAMIAGSLLAAHPANSDTLIENIRGYTWQEAGLHRFAALRFDQSGRVVATYPSDAALDAVPDGPLTIIDGRGATLLPGLIDAHGHILGLGRARSRVDLVGTRSLQEALERIAKYARDNPGDDWILGRGWNQELWQHNRFPRAADLDSLDIERPIRLSRVDGHASWANSLAMMAAGVNHMTADPHGGRLIRDKHGKPTGIFVDEAETLINRVVPPPTRLQDRRALVNALQRLASVGLTSVHDAGIDMRTAALYRELDAAGALPIRVYAMLAEDSYRDFGKPLLDNGTGFLAIQSVKVYLDGALGSRGAALIEPYSDQPANRGLLFKQTDAFTALLDDAAGRGFQVNVHAIGDAANQVALDGFAMRKEKSPLRHRIEHAQVIRMKDIQRFAELGVIASMQPTHATSDKNMAEDRIGAERIKGAYAWRRLLDTGAVLAGGSDFPVEPEQPMFGLHAAVTRQDRNNQPDGGWYADQSLHADEALRIFTIDAAYAAGQEQHLGSLEPGKRADFVLLDSDIFEIAPRDIWRTTVRETWVNGVCIYQASN